MLSSDVVVRIAEAHLGLSEDTSGGSVVDPQSSVAVVRAVDVYLRKLVDEARKHALLGRKQRLGVDDVNAALERAGEERVYGLWQSSRSESGSGSGNGSGSGGGRTGKAQTPAQAQGGASGRAEMISLIDAATCELPPCPIRPELAMHWLSVAGVQPRVPENPVLQDGYEASRRMAAAAVTAAGGAGQSRVLAQAQASQQQQAQGGGGGIVRHDPSGIGHAFGAVTTASASEGSGSGPQIRLSVPHVLPNEMQMFFRKATDMLVSKNPVQVRRALVSLETDAGLGELMPYFAKFILEQVKQHNRDLDRLLVLMEAFDSLLKNPHMDPEVYLHQLMPAVFTCVVGARLCRDPRENHWRLRIKSAALIQQLCQRYTNVYADLLPRVSKTYLTVLQRPNAKPPTTVYGALVGVQALGRNSVNALVVPCAPQLLARLAMPEAGPVVGLVGAGSDTACGGATEEQEEETEAEARGAGRGRGRGKRRRVEPNSGAESTGDRASASTSASASAATAPAAGPAAQQVEWTTRDHDTAFCRSLLLHMCATHLVADAGMPSLAAPYATTRARRRQQDAGPPNPLRFNPPPKAAGGSAAGVGDANLASSSKAPRQQAAGEKPPEHGDASTQLPERGMLVALSEHGPEIFLPFFVQATLDDVATLVV